MGEFFYPRPRRPRACACGSSYVFSGILIFGELVITRGGVYNKRVIPLIINHMDTLELKNSNWISIVHPTAEEMESLHKNFPQIHPLVLEELQTPTIRPRAENYDDHIYAVLHFPSFSQKQNKTIPHEIDFILTKDTLITVGYEENQLLENIIKSMGEDPDLRDQYGKTPVHLIYYVLREFFAFALKELDQIQGKIDEIEEEVFAGREKEILEDISILKRNILDFRRAIKPQQNILESLVFQGTQLFGEKTKPFLIDLLGEYFKVWNMLENHKETLDALYETNSSLLMAKTNETMRAFTVIAFISFIPTAIANIYGMNILHIPLSERPYAFWEIMGLMALVTGIVYLALKWRKLV